MTRSLAIASALLLSACDEAPSPPVRSSIYADGRSLVTSAPAPGGTGFEVFVEEDGRPAERIFGAGRSGRADAVRHGDHLSICYASQVAYSVTTGVWLVAQVDGAQPIDSRLREPISWLAQNARCDPDTRSDAAVLLSGWTGTTQRTLCDAAHEPTLPAKSRAELERRCRR